MSGLRDIDLDQLAVELTDVVEQACYDEETMRKLSNLLAVDSSSRLNTGSEVEFIK